MNVNWVRRADLEASVPTQMEVSNVLVHPVSPATRKSAALISTNACPMLNRLPFVDEAPFATICPELSDANAPQDSRATPKSLVKVSLFFSSFV